MGKHEAATPTSESHRRWPRIATFAAVGVLALGGVKEAWDRIVNTSGEYTLVSPRHTVPQFIDGRHVVGDWNMHDETAARTDQIRVLAERHELDVIALQEVSADDARALSDELPDWYVAFVMGDRKQRPLEGGYGDVLMSRQKPEDIATASINGTSMVDSAIRAANGLFDDIAEAATTGAVDLRHTKDGMQEYRAAIAFTVKVRDGNGELKDVRMMTGHIAHNEVVHAKQLQELMEFIKDNVKHGRPTIFCGDLNALPEEVILKFAELGFIVPETRHTSLSHKTIDYCAYDPEDVLGLGRVTVLKQPRTDHFQLIGEWNSQAAG